MSQPENQYLVHKIRASITAGIRPCALIFREQPTDPWTDYDFAFIEAYQTIKDETCSQCGNPIWLCRSTSNDIYVTVKQGECRGTRALEAHKDGKKKSKDRASSDEKKEWGKFYYTEFDLLPPSKAAGVKMPTRSDFYNNLENLASDRM